MVMLADVYLSWSKKVIQSSQIPEEIFNSLIGQLWSMLVDYTITIASCMCMAFIRMYPDNNTTTTKWSIIAEALFLSNITRLFFMSLTLIWPEGLPSLDIDLAIVYQKLLSHHSSIKVPIESVLLTSLGFVNRSIALSAILGSDILAILISIFGSFLNILFTTSGRKSEMIT